MDFPHKGLVMQKVFSSHDVVMTWSSLNPTQSHFHGQPSTREGEPANIKEPTGCQPPVLSQTLCMFMIIYPDSKVHGADMGPTWVLSDPDGPHVGPMNLAIRVGYHKSMLHPLTNTRSETGPAVSNQPACGFQAGFRVDRVKQQRWVIREVSNLNGSFEEPDW